MLSTYYSIFHRHITNQPTNKIASRRKIYQQNSLLLSFLNKSIGDDMKAAARQSLNCIKNKKK